VFKTEVRAKRRVCGVCKGWKPGLAAQGILRSNGRGSHLELGGGYARKLTL
jgi:hypothetical protein